MMKSDLSLILVSLLMSTGLMAPAVVGCSAPSVGTGGGAQQSIDAVCSTTSCSTTTTCGTTCGTTTSCATTPATPPTTTTTTEYEG